MNSETNIHEIVEAKKIQTKSRQKKNNMEQIERLERVCKELTNTHIQLQSALLNMNTLANSINHNMN